MSETYGSHPKISPHAEERMQTLAREAQLLEECFINFQLVTYPTATPVVSEAMRRCFFAGAAALSALLQARLATDTEINEKDTYLLMRWLAEVTAFHENTIGTLNRQTNRTDSNGRG